MRKIIEIEVDRCVGCRHLHMGTYPIHTAKQSPTAKTIDGII